MVSRQSFTTQSFPTLSNLLVSHWHSKNTLPVHGHTLHVDSLFVMSGGLVHACIVENLKDKVFQDA